MNHYIIIIILFGIMGGNSSCMQPWIMIHFLNITSLKNCYGNIDLILGGGGGSQAGGGSVPPLYIGMHVLVVVIIVLQ